MKVFLALALAAVMAAGVSAQSVVQTAAQQDLRSSTSGASSQIDNRVASCLILANLGEIELAKFGEENLDDGDVKKFAETLVEDHQKLVKDLERFAPQAASTKLSSKSGSSDSGSSNRAQQSSTQSMAAQSPTDKKMFQIQKQAVQNCVAMTKKELQESSGKDMDQAFVGCQVGSHIKMLAELKAAENEVSGDLQQVIADAKKKVQSHLDKAKKLMMEQQKS